MKAVIQTLSILACGAAMLAPRAARADDPPSIYSYAWHDSRLRTGYGVSATLGGGVGGFTDKAMRDTLTQNVAAMWNLRVTLGSHTPLGLDLGYLGSAATINALIGQQSSTLVGSTFEGALRWNILPHAEWNPYAFAGIGWQRYDITGGGFKLSDTGMNSSDNSVVFPMGAGLAYRDKSGVVLDVHGTFRANTNAGLVLESPGGSSYVPMHTWEAGGALGYEF